MNPKVETKSYYKATLVCEARGCRMRQVGFSHSTDKAAVRSALRWGRDRDWIERGGRRYCCTACMTAGEAEVEADRKGVVA